MKIEILCSDPTHPVIEHLRSWQQEHVAKGHLVELVHDRKDLSQGDVLFLVSCSQLIGRELRENYRAALVLHASDLPTGRGWSPHVWSILEGDRRITVCLLAAEDPVDTGPVWLRTSFQLDGSELLPEINERLFRAELELMTRAVSEFDSIVPQPQEGEPGEYRRKRTASDSRIDPHKTLAEQFELLRVVDANRYPAFMDFRGHRYLIKLEKVGDSE